MNTTTEDLMETRLLLQSELASRWRISPRTLERWRHTGEGPRFCKIGGRVTYREDDVIAFESEQIRQVTDGIPRR
jgi:predicted site-specific integrase-resolvase